MRMIEGRICARAVDEWLHYRDRSIDKHYCDVSGGDAIFSIISRPRSRSSPVCSPVTVERVSLASNCWSNYSVENWRKILNRSTLTN